MMNPVTPASLLFNPDEVIKEKPKERYSVKQLAEVNKAVTKAKGQMLAKFLIEERASGRPIVESAVRVIEYASTVLERPIVRKELEHLGITITRKGLRAMVSKGWIEERPMWNPKRQVLCGYCKCGLMDEKETDTLASEQQTPDSRD